MSRLSIRPMTVADVDCVAEAERVCFSDPWSRASIAGCIGCDFMRTYIAEDENGDTVGYAITSIAADEAELLNIAVLAPYRRFGYGSELLAYILADMSKNGAANVWLEVRESNSAARALYEKFGFTAAGRRRRYYDNPREDAIVMTLQLKNHDRQETTQKKC